MEDRQSRRAAERENKARVFRYLAILFAAAFLLLLLAFLMQNRANQQALDDLTASVNSFHSPLQNLVDANASLQAENDELKEALSQAQEQLEALTGLPEALAGTSAAMDWFWQIDEAFVRGRYTLCRELMAAMEAQELVQFLPTESVTDNGRFSPADRYQEIRTALG